MSTQSDTERLKKLYELSMTLSGDPMDIFVHVARMIGDLLNVKVVCLSEIRGGELYFLSVYVQGKVFVNPGHCPLDITPCATVETSKAIKIYDRVSERFPDAGFLRQHNAFAYCGFPSLNSDGKVVAVTCLLDDRPHDFTVEDQALLSIIGQRIGMEITRKQADEARRLSEARFRDIAGIVGEFIWEVDLEGRFTYLTEQVSDTYGYPAAAMLGRTHFEFTMAEDIPWVRGYFESVIRERHLFRHLEQRVRSASGEEVWISVSGVPLINGADQVTGIRGTTLNITQGKRVEQALKDSEANFRLITEALPDAFWIANPTLEKNLYVSPGYERILGRSSETLQESIQDFIDSAHPDDSGLMAELVDYAKSGRAHEVECRMVRTSGSIAWIWVQVYPVWAPDGHISHQVGIARDITDRKRVDMRLRETEERLQLALSGASLGLWDWDLLTGYVYYSYEWGAMLGYAREDIEPTYEQWARLVHPDDIDAALSILHEHLRGATPAFQLEHRLRTKQNEWKWVWSSGRVWERDPEGRPLRVAGIHLDISDRKALEERLSQQQAMLTHAQRVTTAGELATTIVHELNQPLGSIANTIGAVKLEFASVFQQHTGLRDAFEEILRLSRRAGGVIRGIRNLVSRRETENENVSLPALVEEILFYLNKELVRRHIQTHLDIPALLPPVSGSRIQLQQLLLNLILNAMDALLEVDRKRRRLTVRMKFTATHGWVIEIGDNGPGIAATIAERLFEPFQTTKTNGIGLGLSLCRTIAEMHGGSISVQSVPGQGACFSVHLPIAMEAPRHE